MNWKSKLKHLLGSAKSPVDEDFETLADHIKTSNTLDELYAWQRSISDFDTEYRGRCAIQPYIDEFNYLISQRRKQLERASRLTNLQ